MAELDLSLSDALTDSVPQPGPESLVERDFVAQLEAEAFDDQVGETVGKTDFIPLLDNDDTRAGESDMMERSGTWVSVEILFVSTVIREREEMIEFCITTDEAHFLLTYSAVNFIGELKENI